ncbi:hypothetical protein GOQ27_02255 [Clostridium sp. D2Q-11]|uniref:Acetyltransferase (GNAT) domain-containing protein n=1 Tax=Anaeromonas frigoriresistens TaxID=2683708 RepID=A0A942Z7H3_9FIRM|nr:hypothetical protein [Anaeromonas frigoriresistens]MBS4537263.1 hypothetical protein [Anaeromonas frigoriresistens]
MDIQIYKCEFREVDNLFLQNIKNFSSPFDSFLEEHITESNFYQILIQGRKEGYFSVYKEATITSFFINKEFRDLSQEIFNKIKKYESVQKALVFTGDEFFLSHALDNPKKFDLQAYFFQDSKREINDEQILKNFRIRKADIGDVDIITKKSGDFFDKIEIRVKEGEIYIGFLGEDIVSFGIFEKSKIYNNIASIGMYVIKEKRISGIGRNTLIKLKELCYSMDIQPLAGCWYYNHNSKKTLESAGMYSQTRLINIHF